MKEEAVVHAVEHQNVNRPAKVKTKRLHRDHLQVQNQENHHQHHHLKRNHHQERHQKNREHQKLEPKHREHRKQQEHRREKLTKHLLGEKILLMKMIYHQKKLNQH